MSWITPFLAELRTTGVVASACRAAAIYSQAAYGHKRADSDFAAAWDNALEDATDKLEAEARRRALDGVDEPVVYQGQLTPIWERDEHGEVVMLVRDTGQVYKPSHERAGQPIMAQSPQQLVIDGRPQWLTINKKSDPMLMFLLKGLRKKYGTETHEMTGKDGAPLAVVDETKRLARVSALIELAKQRKADNDVDFA